MSFKAFAFITWSNNCSPGTDDNGYIGKIAPETDILVREMPNTSKYLDLSTTSSMGSEATAEREESSE